MSSLVLAANKMFTTNEIGGIENSDESIEKCEKLLKTRKISKVQKIAKSKKPFKSENWPNFYAKNSGLCFLTPKARAVFNRLQLAFTKAPILWYFDLECYIRIETDELGYAIGCVLSQLACRIKPDKLITKTDFG